MNTEKYGMLNNHTNDMTRLLNMIENQLQLKNFPLPDQANKDTWPAIIMDQTLPVFSEYFPNVIDIIVDPTTEKDGFYFIDKDIEPGVKILGIQDIDWMAFRNAGSYYERYGLNTIDAQTWMSRHYALDDIALTQTGSDLVSLFNLQIYPVFVKPNKIRLESVNGAPVHRWRSFPLKVLIEHTSLFTLSPTMMKSFIKLCMCDISDHILSYIKYYSNMDTVYGSIDLQLDRLQDWSNKREDILREYSEASMTTANESLPLIWTV